jgi:hypothetical protein
MRDNSFEMAHKLANHTIDFINSNAVGMSAIGSGLCIALYTTCKQQAVSGEVFRTLMESLIEKYE